MRLLTSLTPSIGSLSRREPLWRCSSRRTILWGVLCLTGLNISPAIGVDNSQTNALKLYAHSRIIDAKEYQCIEMLWTKESNWNPKARLGSHYGIPQGRSIYLKNADPYEQIDWGLKYLRNRYSKDFACEALAHMKAKGYS